MLYMQPVQDITVDDRVSRTQYQYTLEDPDTDELNQWTNKFVDAAEEAARAGRRGHGSADRRPRDSAEHRPRDRIAAGHCAHHDRQHALRRLRAAPDQHALHAAEPVPRGSGDRAEWQQNPSKLGDLYIQSNASSGATGAGAATSFSSSASASAGSNALTTSVRYTPSSQAVNAPSTVLAGGTTAATTPT